MVAEIPTLEFEFDPNPLPLARVYLTFCFAIRVPRLNSFDVVAEFARDHPEEEHDPLLVDRLMSESTKVDGVSIGRAVREFGVSETRYATWDETGWRRCDR